MLVLKRLLIVGCIAAIEGILNLYIAAKADSNSTASEISFFQRHYMRRGNYKDLPLPNEDVGTLKLYAARGEYEPIQFLIRSPRRMDNISVVLDGNLKGNDCSIPANNVDIRIVVDQKHWLNPRCFERMPYLLMNKKRFSLKPDETERIWVTVHVPTNASPGIYRGNVNVLEGGRVLKTIPVELNVWPFELKKITPDEMMYFMYFYPANMPAYVKDKKYQIEAYRDMREHGMNSMVAYNDFLTCRDYLDILKESGMLQKGSKYIWLGAGFVSQGTLAKVNKMVEGAGMDIMYYGQDEPETEERQKNQRKITRKLKAIFPEKKIVTTVGEKGIKAVGDSLDAWIIEAIDMNERFKKEADEKGKSLYSYECRIAPTDPLTIRHYWGYLVWRVGAKGAAGWAYSDFVSAKNRFGLLKKKWNSYEPDYQYHFDYVFCAPDGIIPSIGWDGGVREGIDDYRYIATLEYWIKNASRNGKPELAADGKKLLDELRQQINPQNYRNAFDKAFNSKEPGRCGAAGTNYNRSAPEPAMKPQDYDTIRLRIAQEIVKISNALTK